jgi:hypothetical protein
MAYFAISGIISTIVLVGGFVIIIKDSNQSNYDWAQNLIAMCVTLWMPSPADSIKEIISMREQRAEKRAQTIERSLSINGLHAPAGTRDDSTIQLQSYDKNARPLYDPRFFPARNSINNTVDAALLSSTASCTTNSEIDIEKGLPTKHEYKTPKQKTPTNNTNTDSLVTINTQGGDQSVKIKVELVD